MVKPRLPSPPTIACLIAEQDESGTLEIVDGGLAERSLVEGLDKLELDARVHAETGVDLSAADLLAAVSGDLDKASHYARESLADAAVLGIVTVVREELQDQRGTARTRATLEVRVFRGSDGDMLEVFAHTAAITGNDPNACREESVTDVATKMLGDITVATVLSVLGAQKRDEVLITLLNPGTHRRLELFEGLLAQDGGVHSIEESYFSERSARIRVGYDGSLSYLVDLIGEKTFDGWYVEVQEVIGREMTLIMVPGDGAEE